MCGKWENFAAFAKFAKFIVLYGDLLCLYYHGGRPHSFVWRFTVQESLNPTNNIKSNRTGFHFKLNNNNKIIFTCRFAVQENLNPNVETPPSVRWLIN